MPVRREHGAGHGLAPVEGRRTSASVAPRARAAALAGRDIAGHDHTGRAGHPSARHADHIHPLDSGHRHELRLGRRTLAIARQLFRPQHSAAGEAPDPPARRAARCPSRATPIDVVDHGMRKPMPLVTATTGAPLREGGRCCWPMLLEGAELRLQAEAVLGHAQRPPGSG